MGSDKKMKFHLTTFVFWSTVLGWLVVGVLIIQYNLFPFDRLTMRWQNPAEASAAFSWNQAPSRLTIFPAGQATLQPGVEYVFTVNLPRSVAQGTLALDFDNPQTRFTVQMERKKSGHPEGVYTAGTLVPIRWADLVSHGRSYHFTIAIVGTEATTLQSVIFHLQR